jgi:Acetyltransferase (GNAT) domain
LIILKNTNKPALKFIIPNEKQKGSWDKCVNNSPDGNIYSLCWYLDVVTNNSWGLITNDEMTTGLPVAFKKRTGYKNVYQPFYTMFFDVINAVGDIDIYLNCIQNDFHKIHITTQSYNHNLIARSRVRQEMKLSVGFAKNYSENATRQIKKAEKTELKFAVHTNAKEVVSIFKKNKGSELKEYKAADFRRLYDLIEACIKHKHGFCAHVTQDGKVQASGFFITYKNRIIFLKGGITETGKKNGAMYFLMHKVFENYHAEFEIFDFGGSNNKNVGDFYRKLGGKDLPYLEIDIDRRNILQKVIGKLKK